MIIARHINWNAAAPRRSPTGIAPTCAPHAETPRQLVDQLGQGPDRSRSRGSMVMKTALAVTFPNSLCRRHLLQSP